MIHRIGPEQTYLTHIDHDFGTHEEICTLCPPGITPAYDGLTIEL